MIVPSSRNGSINYGPTKAWSPTSKAEVLRYLEQLYVNHAPEFIYFKTLFHVFERFLSGQADDAQLFDRTAIVDTDIWKALFDFQKDGAKGAIHKINAHNGCILADSVGFGQDLHRAGCHQSTTS